MNKSSFVYVIYIRTTLEKAWDALLKPEFTRAYWFGVTQESAWAPGAATLSLAGGPIPRSAVAAAYL